MSSLPLEDPLTRQNTAYGAAIPSRDTVLTVSERIGSGNDRDIWRHPLHRSLGIKTDRPDHARAQNDIDFDYGMHLAHLGVAGPHLPRVHGWVATNKGRGLVVDLVLQPDGTPSPTLPQTLRSGQIDVQEAIRLIDEGFAWLGSHGVMLVDYGIHNMLVQDRQPGEPARLVFVDGLGARHFDFKYRARCAFRPLECWTAREKARTFRNKTLGFLHDRSSKLWVAEKG